MPHTRFEDKKFFLSTMTLAVGGWLNSDLLLSNSWLGLFEILTASFPCLLQKHFIIKRKVSIFPSDTEQLLLCYSQWHTDQNRDNIHHVAIFRSVSRHGMVRSTRERKTELITNKIFDFAKLKEYEKKSDNDIDNLPWQCVSRSGIVWHFHLELY